MKKTTQIIVKISGFFAGTLSGYAYYAVKGCESGCLIWSSPWLSALIGGFFGFMLLDTALDFYLKNEKK